MCTYRTLREIALLRSHQLLFTFSVCRWTVDFNDCAAPGCKLVYFCCKVNMAASEVAAGREQEAREEEVQGSTTWPSPGRDKGVDHTETLRSQQCFLLHQLDVRSVRRNRPAERSSERWRLCTFIFLFCLFLQTNQLTAGTTRLRQTSFINCVRKYNKLQWNERVNEKNEDRRSGKQSAALNIICSNVQ